LITGLVMAADRRGIAPELLRETAEMSDTQALKFHSPPQFSTQGGHVLNAIEELRQFLLNAITPLTQSKTGMPLASRGPSA
jgi:hypothetical protein